MSARPKALSFAEQLALIDSALATLEPAPADCKACGETSQLCECHLDEPVIERCDDCFHYLAECDCEEIEDDAETMRADSRGYAEVSR